MFQRGVAFWLLGSELDDVMICLATLLIAYSSNWMKDLDREPESWRRRARIGGAKVQMKGMLNQYCTNGPNYSISTSVI
jgi:hypothetical protein